MLFLNTAAATLSPVGLFLQADWVVRGVMIGLILASLWTWAIILSFGFRVGAVKKGIAAFETEYRDADDGYHRRDGEREFYRRVYRRGFEVGYRESFDRNQRYRDYRR